MKYLLVTTRVTSSTDHVLRKEYDIRLTNALSLKNDLAMAAKPIVRLRVETERRKNIYSDLYMEHT